MYVYVSLLRYLILRNDVQVCKTLVQECRHIVGFLQNLRVDIVVYERQEFLENTLNVLDLVQVRLYKRGLRHETLLFFLVPSILNYGERVCLLFEFELDLRFFVF